MEKWPKELTIQFNKYGRLKKVLDADYDEIYIEQKFGTQSQGFYQVYVEKDGVVYDGGIITKPTKGDRT
jgi:hypothetical protein